MHTPPSPSCSVPVLVLDDSCVIDRDLSRHVMGRVKNLNSIPNLRSLLAKEGFPKVKLSYLGGLWVMIELDDVASKQSLLKHVGINSWFHNLQDAFHDFVSDECVVWVDIEGIPFNVWSRKTFVKIGNKWGETMDIEDNFGSSFARKRLCIKTKQPDTILEKFKVTFRGKVFMVRKDDGFVEAVTDSGAVKENTPLVNAKVMNNSQEKRVGDGWCTLFLDDLWISDVPLRDRFPHLFALELDKEVSVADKLGTLSVAGSFRRDVRDGAERHQWAELSSLVGSVSLSSSKDRWSCDLTGDVCRWFALRARRDSLPTRHNLSRRGVALDSVVCPICDSDVEDIQHVMFRCDMAQLVFRKICRWWDLDGQDLSSFSDWQVWFSSIRLSSSIKSILEGIFCVALVEDLDVSESAYF
ncbi:RNA-directed DNA polymerase, eukaryota [Artemisia annua]|uniref:RNA-directed DNA polymerase, eukaryota n=1 Tax=Artemisia annua TaxID=35608 RepID=A0A2U1M9Y2_ARTAN|nr:RNA-directed DNA polymerase, eukaryota [Artemisia annua]